MLLIDFDGRVMISQILIDNRTDAIVRWFFFARDMEKYRRFIANQTDVTFWQWFASKRFI